MGLLSWAVGFAVLFFVVTIVLGVLGYLDGVTGITDIFSKLYGSHLVPLSP